MKPKYVGLGGVLVIAALTSVSAYAWQVSPEEHAKHHPAGKAGQAAPGPKAKGLRASSVRLDELVAKMNATQGQAKVDAMAELLTALVQQHQAMHGGMDEMMSKMKNKDGADAK